MRYSVFKYGKDVVKVALSAKRCLRWASLGDRQRVVDISCFGLIRYKAALPQHRNSLLGRLKWLFPRLFELVLHPIYIAI